MAYTSNTSHSVNDSTGGRNTYNTCLRCGYAWSPRSGLPVRCPKCKTTRWNAENVTHTCLRCGAQWNQRGDTLPRYCPSCHSCVWNEPKVEFICPQCGKSRTLRSNSRKDQCPYCDGYKGVDKENHKLRAAPRKIAKPVRIWSDGKGHVLMYSRSQGIATVYDEGILIATTNLNSWLISRGYVLDEALLNFREEYMQKEFNELAQKLLTSDKAYESRAESIKALHPVSDTVSEILALSESGMQPVAIALKLRITFSEVMSALSNIPPMQPPAKLDKNDEVEGDEKSQSSEMKGQKARIRKNRSGPNEDRTRDLRLVRATS